MLTDLSPEIRQLGKILQEKVLPWVENGAPLVLFDDPPRCLTPFEMEEQAIPALPEVLSEGPYPHVQKWRQQRLNALRAPMLGCVFDGEADYRVCPPPGKEGRQWIVPLKAGSLFLVAPGTPFSDGTKVAWERPEAEKAFSRVVLMQLRPDGVICRSFTCDKGKVWLHPIVFLYDFEIFQLGEKILEEMRRARPSLSVVCLYTQLMLHLLLRTFDEGNVFGLRAKTTTPLEDEIWLTSTLPDRPVVTLAEHYIKSHLDDPGLKANAIALHVGLSERHLNRLFKNATGLTLSAHIDQERLEKAQMLLRHSHLPVSSVASYCGFTHPAHFSSWFTRHARQSPRQFRQHEEA